MCTTESYPEKCIKALCDSAIYLVAVQNNKLELHWMKILWDTFDWSNLFSKMSVLDVHTGELIHRSQLDPENHGSVEDENQEDQTNLNDMLRDR